MFSYHAKCRASKRTSLSPCQILSMIRENNVVLLKKKPGIPKLFYLLNSPFDKKDYVVIVNEYTGKVITILHFYFQANFALGITQEMRNTARELSKKHFALTDDTTANNGVDVNVHDLEEENVFIAHIYYSDAGRNNRRSKVLFKIDADLYNNSLDEFLSCPNLDETLLFSMANIGDNMVHGISVCYKKSGKRIMLDDRRVVNLVKKAVDNSGA